MPKTAKSKSRYKREILSTPASLVENGKIHFGTFNAPLRNVNPLDAARVFGFPLPRFLKNMRLKEWEAFQLGNDDYFALAVIYNQKVGTLVQFILCDKKNNRMTKYEKKVPSWRTRVPSSLGDTRARYISDNFRLEIHNRLDRGRIFIDVAIDGDRELPPLYGHFEAFHESGTARPLVVSLPFASNRGMYSHKCLMPMEGVLFSGDRRVDFARKSSFAIVDDHKGYYPYILKYDWVTGAGFTAKGLTGFNLTDNQVPDRERYNENCLWLGRELHLLPPVTFSRPKGVHDRWCVRDEYGMVDITFTPVFENPLKMNLVAIRTDYHGPFGHYDGVIRTSKGGRISVKGFYGMGEKKFFRG